MTKRCEPNNSAHTADMSKMNLSTLSLRVSRYPVPYHGNGCRDTGRCFHLHTKIGQSFVISKFSWLNLWENIPRHAEMVASSGLFFNQAQFLHVNGLHHLLAVGDGRLLKSLTAAQFFYDAGFFKFTFEFLKRSFDEFAFFYLYDDHILMVSFEFAFTLARQN